MNTSGLKPSYILQMEELMAFFQGILFFCLFFNCSESDFFFQHKLNHQSPYSSHDSLNLIYMRVWIPGFIPYFLFCLAPLRTMYFTKSMSPFFFHKLDSNVFSRQPYSLPAFLCGRKGLSDSARFVSAPLCCPLASFWPGLCRKCTSLCRKMQ